VLKVILGTDSVQFPLTGIGRYTFEIAKVLLSSSRVEDIRFLSRYDLKHVLPKEPTVSDSPSKASFASFKKKLTKIGLVSDFYRIVNPRIQQYALRSHSDYIYHGPNFYLPHFDGLKVATFHDLSPFKWAHCHPPDRVRFMQKELRRTIDIADALITDSDYTKQELASYFGLPLDKIYTVPLAASREFCPRTEDECSSVLRAYSLNFKGYSLYVGTIEPRKNLESLLIAYANLPIHLRQRFPLVISGYRGWKSEGLHNQIERAVAEGWAIYLGFVPSSHLPMLYSAASVFVFPSHYEGFGLPVLEAMASGTAVVCSNSSSIPEVAGGAALMGDPLDIDLLTENVKEVLESCEYRKVAVERGLVQSKQFSWELCATKTIDVYQVLLEKVDSI